MQKNKSITLPHNTSNQLKIILNLSIGMSLCDLGLVDMTPEVQMTRRSVSRTLSALSLPLPPLASTV